MTNPTASTNIPAGKPFSITWQDDGKAPNLTAFGPATVGLYVGSESVQVCSVPHFLVVLRLMIHRMNCKQLATLMFLRSTRYLGHLMPLLDLTTTPSECCIFFPKR